VTTVFLFAIVMYVFTLISLHNT